MHRLPYPFKTAGGVLLRVLILWFSKVSPHTGAKELLRLILEFLRFAFEGLLLYLFSRAYAPFLVKRTEQTNSKGTPRHADLRKGCSSVDGVVI